MINYEREQMQSVGFIGLGIMGMPMVKNLLNAGFEVNIWNRTVEKSDQLSNQGANSCQSPGDVARNSEVIIICVTATSDVEAVLLGSESITDPIINGVEKSNIVIDMSTISPARTREFAIQLNSIGASMLDAPISGGEQGAIDGTLSIMVGGDTEILSKVNNIFEVLGSRITHCGPNGAGQTVKLCNQIAVCINNFAMAEALIFCEASGVDPETMLEAITAGAAGSWQLSNLGMKIVERDFSPGFKVGLQQKDLRLALEAADQLNVSLTGTSIVHQFFSSVERSLDSDVGTQALITSLEAMNNLEVGGKK